jgi:hypothetical protein
VNFSERDVRRKIGNLSTDAASGPDGIGPKILQELEDSLAPAPTILFRKSMEEGGVPKDWKEANVTPIFKKGSKASPSNYRPVLLTSVSCKIMESIIQDAMTDHLERNKLIESSQHGFMQGKSCTTNPIPGKSYNSSGER